MVLSITLVSSSSPSVFPSGTPVFSFLSLSTSVFSLWSRIYWCLGRRVILVWLLIFCICKNVVGIIVQSHHCSSHTHPLCFGYFIITIVKTWDINAIPILKYESFVFLIGYCHGHYSLWNLWQCMKFRELPLFDFMDFV